MLRKLVVVSLILAVIPVTLLVLRACDAEGPEAAANTDVRLTSGRPPGAGTVLMPIRVPRTGAAETPRAGDRIDVCLARGKLLKALPVRAVSCPPREFHCAALVQVAESRSLQAIVDYDFDRPPIAMTPGAAC